MNYEELRSMFLDLLNRTDCTDEKADSFINFGLRKAERVLRTPLQISVLSIRVGGDFPGQLEVPSDYLMLVTLKVNGDTLERVPDTHNEVGKTGVYRFSNGRFYFGKNPKEGDVIELSYYATFTDQLVTDGYTRYSLVIPDLICYAALIYASDTYMDERKPIFEQTFNTLLTEIQMQADMDEMSGLHMIVKNPYEGLC